VVDLSLHRLEEQQRIAQRDLVELPLTEAEPKEKEASAPPEATAKAEAKKEHMPRLDWAYAAAPDVRFGRLGLCRVWRQA
jgi:hypothetical protein